MKLLDLALKDLITSDFLYYSWIDLKNKSKNLFNSSDIGRSEPLSKNWFNKTSVLIRRGTYDYKNVRSEDDRSSEYYPMYFSKKLFLRKLKNKIIENAFVLILESYLYDQDQAKLKNRNLTECLRL